MAERACPCVEPNMGYWQELLYKSATQSDHDARFFHDALKSAHLEGKMGARELSFSKGGGLPTVMPLPAGQGTTIPVV